MVRKTSTVRGKTYAYYVCSIHKAMKECSPHSISADKLEKTVLFLLQQHISNILELKRILSFIETVPFQQMDMRKLEERRAEKETEIQRCTELEENVLECVKAVGLASLQNLEYGKTHATDKDSLLADVSLLERTLEKYNGQKFSIYDEYTRGKMAREVMAERNAALNYKIEETRKTLAEEREELVRQDRTPEEDTETLSVLSVLDEFAAEKIRYLVDRVLVHGEAEIEIVWNTDDFIAQA